jgi:hypothetical protein
VPKLEAALALAKRGFKVFPIAPGAKFPPLVRDWPVRASAYDGTVADLWAVAPQNANIGIHTEGLLVVDVDVKSSGPASLASLEGVLGLDTATLTTLTPTGGKHLFYRLPEGHPGVANSAGKIAPGIDVKSTRGYVVAPGSVVEAGRYRFEADRPILPAPQWLVDRAGAPREAVSAPPPTVPDAPVDAVADAVRWLSSQPAGEGAYATACGLRDRGLSLRQALALMESHDPRPNVPDKVAHAYTYARGAPGSKAPATADDFPLDGLPIAAPSPAPTPRPRPRLRRLNEVAQEIEGAGEPLVQDVLNKASLAVLAGEPGQGKSFIGLDIAYHVATGQEWHGQRVEQGTALYLAYEGMGGIGARAAALDRHYGTSDVPFYVVAADFNIREQAGRAALGELLAEMPEKPSLIVIDTFAYALCGGDENSAQDVGAFNSGVQALIAHTGACVLVIHHPPKSGSATLRGSGALPGAADTVIEVADGNMTMEKQRDLPRIDPKGFKLVPIAVGTNRHGEAITSCYVKPTEPVSASARKLRGNTQRAWGVLNAARPDNSPITEAEWKQKCEEFLPSGKDAARKAMHDIKFRLVDLSLITLRPDGLIERRLE